jgi:hypothetical protein
MHLVSRGAGKGEFGFYQPLVARSQQLEFGYIIEIAGMNRIVPADNLKE